MVRPVFEWAVWDWFGFVHVEVGVREGGGALEGDGGPCSRGARRGFEGGRSGAGGCGFFEVGGVWTRTGVFGTVEDGVEEVEEEGGG